MRTNEEILDGFRKVTEKADWNAYVAQWIVNGNIKELVKEMFSIGFNEGVQWADENPTKENSRLQEEIIAKKLSSLWISVDDRKPTEEVKTCLALYKGMVVFPAMYSTKRDAFLIWDSECSLDNITHWMPIPQLPEQTKSE